MQVQYPLSLPPQSETFLKIIIVINNSYTSFCLTKPKVARNKHPQESVSRIIHSYFLIIIHISS